MKKFLSKLFSNKSMKSTSKSKKIILGCMFVFVALLLFIAGRTAWLQLVKGRYYTEKAYKQQNSGRTLTPVRGTIYDTNGNVLAISLPAVKIAVNPNYINTYTSNNNINLIEYRDKIARNLSEIAGISYEEIINALGRNTTYAVVKSKADTDLGTEVKNWIKSEKIKGVYVDECYTRYYPNGSLAAHVLGFTGSDDQGLVCGVEVALDGKLAGTPGKILADVDSSGNEIPYDLVRRIEAVDGYNAVLTIDANIQKIIESSMKKAVELYGVEEGACCIVMDARNADLLAMYSYPDFNPNDAYAYPEGTNLAISPDEWQGNTQLGVEYLSTTVWRNKSLTDTYEPGSTFKSIVTAMLLEEATVTKERIVSDEPLTLAGWTIRCGIDLEETEEEENHGEETFEEGVINSCNPVFAKMALEMGLSKFYSYVESFGFYNKTGILLSGEANSIMHSDPQEIDLAVAAFGQRFQVTPIQMAAAYCALANGGTLYTPRVVKYLTDSKGNIAKKYESTPIRQVISTEICEETLGILRKVVSEGTGSKAYVPGYKVAGKTGTSETTETETTGRYVVSFCAVAPSDNPEIVVLVMMDHPTEGNIGGGDMAAPVAAKIVESILEYMGVERELTVEDEKKMREHIYPQDFTGCTLREAYIKMGNDCNIKVIGDNRSMDAVVISVSPKAPADMTRGGELILYTSDVEHEKTTVPDVIGLTFDEARKKIENSGLNIFTSGEGTYVTSQNRPEGFECEVGTVIYLTLE